MTWWCMEGSRRRDAGDLKHVVDVVWMQVRSSSGYVHESNLLELVLVKL